MKDLLGRDLAVGDFVVYYSSIYQIQELEHNRAKLPQGYAKIMIYPASKTSRPASKYTGDMVRIPPEDVTMYLLQQSA